MILGFGIIQFFGIDNNVLYLNIYYIYIYILIIQTVIVFFKIVELQIESSRIHSLLEECIVTESNQSRLV